MRKRKKVKNYKLQNTNITWKSLWNNTRKYESFYIKKHLTFVLIYQLVLNKYKDSFMEG